MMPNLALEMQVGGRSTGTNGSPPRRRMDPTQAVSALWPSAKIRVQALARYQLLLPMLAVRNLTQSGRIAMPRLHVSSPSHPSVSVPEARADRISVIADVPAIGSTPVLPAPDGVSASDIAQSLEILSDWPLPSRTIAGIAVADVDGATAIERIAASLSLVVAPLRIAFLNAHCVNLSRTDMAYRRALGAFTVLPDGVGVDIAAKLLCGAKFTENLNGTDFVPRLLDALKQPLRVALVGGKAGIGAKAAARLSGLVPRHDYIPVADGYFGDRGRRSVLDRLEAAKADIVLVAMGVPSQELFILDHLDKRHGKVFVATGALLDFLAGEVPRAPLMLRRLRLEWAFRLALEPSRLWRRYVLGNPKFLFGIVRDKLGIGPKADLWSVPRERGAGRG